MSALNASDPSTDQAATPRYIPIIDKSPPRPAPTLEYSWKDYNPNAKVLYIRNLDEANLQLSKLPTAAHVLGFDLEWKPTFIKGREENPVALVQLANDNTIFLIQISAMQEFPLRLAELLANPLVVKTGVAIQSDAKKLYKDFHIQMANCVDLSLLARTVDNARWQGKYNSSLGLARLVESYEYRLLGKGKITRSNWEAKLDPLQIEYASNDAHAGYIVHRKLETLKAVMPTPPESIWYSFNSVAGHLQDAQGFPWHPDNPTYDPGPPPPPRVPREGESNSTAKSDYRSKGKDKAHTGRAPQVVNILASARAADLSRPGANPAPPPYRGRREHGPPHRAQQPLSPTFLRVHDASIHAQARGGGAQRDPHPHPYAQRSQQYSGGGADGYDTGAWSSESSYNNRHGQPRGDAHPQADPRVHLPSSGFYVPSSAAHAQPHLDGRIGEDLYTPAPASHTRTHSHSHSHRGGRYGDDFHGPAPSHSRSNSHSDGRYGKDYYTSAPDHTYSHPDGRYAEDNYTPAAAAVHINSHSDRRHGQDNYAPAPAAHSQSRPYVWNADPYPEDSYVPAPAVHPHSRPNEWQADPYVPAPAPVAQPSAEERYRSAGRGRWRAPGEPRHNAHATPRQADYAPNLNL